MPVSVMQEDLWSGLYSYAVDLVYSHAGGVSLHAARSLQQGFCVRMADFREETSTAAACDAPM